MPDCSSNLRWPATRRLCKTRTIRFVRSQSRTASRGAASSVLTRRVNLCYAGGVAPQQRRNERLSARQVSRMFFSPAEKTAARPSAQPIRPVESTGQTQAKDDSRRLRGSFSRDLSLRRQRSRRCGRRSRRTITEDVERLCAGQHRVFDGGSIRTECARQRSIAATRAGDAKEISQPAVRSVTFRPFAPSSREEVENGSA